jgi:hypothetical protein
VDKVTVFPCWVHLILFSGGYGAISISHTWFIILDGFSHLSMWLPYHVSCTKSVQTLFLGVQGYYVSLLGASWFLAMLQSIVGGFLCMWHYHFISNSRWFHPSNLLL